MYEIIDKGFPETVIVQEHNIKYLARLKDKHWHPIRYACYTDLYTKAPKEVINLLDLHFGFGLEHLQQMSIYSTWKSSMYH